MPHHGHDEEHEEREEPVSFQDKRRIDPETGQVRQSAGGQQAADGAAAAGAGEDGDALSQAERILNEAAADAEGDAADAGITGAQDPDTAGASVREEELRTDLLRVQAEFVNYKRRVERDRNVAKDTAIQSVLSALLPVLDDLDAARAAGDLTEGPFAAIATKFDTVLSGFGLERQDQEHLAGQPFDPAQHEAMLRQPSADVPEEHIVQVFRNGYVREGRVLRAAQVMVSAGAEG
ncbi:nucleotide exchange factor GrpE [Micrococcus sp. TA1]|uniref:nucleotide exchange factor GrpE n=1 Tax=Micrococcus sp. TA1 TaxID=681627 RepID=UPI0016207DA4|nr:nucleotide exchange factor GrpE [Micrococcus sp. TA1]MBB5749844.1 molecular chaperone GrpE [Micrococcus sp. TA1]